MSKSLYEVVAWDGPFKYADGVFLEDAEVPAWIAKMRRAKEGTSITWTWTKDGQPWEPPA